MAKTRDEKRAYHAAYYQLHKEEAKAKFKLHYEANKSRYKAYAREWAARNPGKMAEMSKLNSQRKRQTLYGLAPEKFAEMLSSQGDRCAICASSKPTRRGWHVDHDHVTGAVRGILCARCNMALGLFRDDVHVLISAATYLSKSAKKAAI